MLRRLSFSVALACVAAGCGMGASPSAVAPVAVTAAGRGDSAGGPAPAATPTLDPAPDLAVVLPGEAAPRLVPEVVARYPHDTSAFTEGLVFDQGELYESTGLEGSSTLRRVELRTGSVLASTTLAPNVFGEGLALVGDELVQLSWKNNIAFVYDRATLGEVRQLPYQGEGWGLCYDGSELVQSDGSNVLRRRDPATFAELGTVAVLDGTAPVTQLNELECVNGSVYANVWMTNDIVRIDPASGQVTARVDASTLAPTFQADLNDVLNGIAYDPADGTLLLTGKRWDTVYRVRLAT